MLRAFANAFRTPDLRRKLLFVLFIITIFRLGSQIPAPGVNVRNVQSCLSGVGDNSLYSLINLFSGGALLQLTIFALGIMPYITASIILQLLVVVIPRLEALKKEGQSGQTKITQYTRYLTLGLAVLQASGIVALARTQGRLIQGCNLDLLYDQGTVSFLVLVVTMTAGTAVIMWLGELITERGVGNGMSLLIFTQVISGFPSSMWAVRVSRGWWVFGVVIAVGLAVVAAVIFMEQGQRRIPVQYAKRVVGRKMTSGGSTYLPLRVNMAGVIPVIFAASIMAFPPTVGQLLNTPAALDFAAFFAPNRWAYVVGEIFFIVIFTYFYTAVTFNPVDQADNLKKYGGFIPGVRPGRPTAEYLDRILSRLTFAGAIYLGFVAALPTILISQTSANFFFGGTSILIVVGVALDTVKQLEAQLMMRNYEGFLK